MTDHTQAARALIDRHAAEDCVTGAGLAALQAEIAALLAREAQMRDALENWRDAFLPLSAMRNSFDYELKLTDAALAPIAADAQPAEDSVRTVPPPPCAKRRNLTPNDSQK